MNRQRGPRAVALSVAAIALLSLAACGDAAAPSASLLPRDTVVPVSVVTQYFPDVTKEASTGPNETSVGKPIASRSVVFCQRRRKEEGDSLRRPVRQRQRRRGCLPNGRAGSKAAPGFNPAATPESGAGGVRRHLAGRRRDALRSRGTRRQADHVRHARGRHPRHARQLEQPHQPRRT